jgi:hypothetical protein
MLQALIPVLHLLLPRAYFSASNGSGDELSSYLKSYNEVLHCFVTIGIVYPEDTFTYLLHVMEPFFLSPACMHYLPEP